MSIIPENVFPVINNLVPAAVRNDITSFTFYDNHPRDTNIIDITVCTKARELKEFYQRDLISTIYLDTTSIPTKINILRSKNADLFYLVQAGSDLLIISKKDKLKLHKKITNVEKYEVEDVTCKGYACLKVLCFEDAVPLVFDDNLKQLQDTLLQQTSTCLDDTLPIITQLQRKLTEAKYSTKCNEKTYEEFLNIRHRASYSLYEKFKTNVNDSLYNSDLKEITGTLKVLTHTPWIKTCNEKLLIGCHIENRNTEALDDIQVLLHGTLRTSVVYTTKLFTKTDRPPFWREEPKQKLQPNIKAAITVVIDLKELKDNTLCVMEFSGFIFFKKSKEKHLLPLDNITVSSSEAMKEEFNILSDKKLDPNIILALLATTKRTDVSLRHIKSKDDLSVSILELFCVHLQMECIQNMNNIVVHRISPYHTLHGVMIVFPENYTLDVDQCSISLHTRTKSQVLTLIHCIYNDVPAKIVITPHNYKITAKIEDFSSYNEELSEEQEQCLNYYIYVSSVLNRTDLVLQYLDNSIIKMNQSKCPTVQSKVGQEIYVFGGSVENYLEFRGKMLEEGAKGIESLLNVDVSEKESDAMIVD